MRLIQALGLAAVFSVPGMASAQAPPIIDVDCSIEGALARALKQAAKLGGADLHLSGVCEGGVTIATDGVTLRGVTPDAAIVPPDAPPPVEVLVTVVDAQVSLRHLEVLGGVVGALARGRGTDLLLFDVEMAGQSAAVFAREGAEARLLECLVRDGDVGVLADSGSRITLQQTTVTGHDSGVAIFDRSRAGIIDSTIGNNATGGLQVDERSSAGISGGAFHDNGQTHVFAGNRSDVTLVGGVALGSESDATDFALGASDDSSISSFNIPVIHGNLSALDRGALRIGNATVTGYLGLSIFSDAYVSSSVIEQGIFCSSGSSVACAGNSTTGVIDGCPPSDCEVPPATEP